MLFVISLVPITNINHFRWYAGLLIFCLACQYIFIKKNKKYLLLAFFSAFMHFSFIMPFGLLLFYMVVGNKFKLFYLLVIASFLLSSLTLPYLQDFLDSLSGAVQGRVKGYTNQNYVDDVKERSGERIWILQYSMTIAKFYMLAVLVYVKHFTRYLDSVTNNLYAFTLLILSFANFGKDIESVGSRFTLAFVVFGSFILARAFANSKMKTIHWTTYLGVPVYLMITFVTIRMSMEVVNVSLFLPLIITPISLNSQLSFYNIFK